VTRLPVTTGHELIRLLVQIGFYEARVHGSHHLLRHADGRRTAVPVHGHQDITYMLLMRILREIHLAHEDYARLAEAL
jgi:predicted RNA binding protein YcfA (HicA-like mRNA interferase family)